MANSPRRAPARSPATRQLGNNTPSLAKAVGARPRSAKALEPRAPRTLQGFERRCPLLQPRGQAGWGTGDLASLRSGTREAAAPAVPLTPGDPSHQSLTGLPARAGKLYPPAGGKAAVC